MRSRANVLNMEEIGSGIQSPNVNEERQYLTIQESFKPCLKESEKFKKQKLCKQSALVAVLFILCAVFAFGGAMLAVHIGGIDKSDKRDVPSKMSQDSYPKKHNKGAVCAPDANKTQKVFPSLDYAVFGYNILGAYPLSFGHDPGFTHPIFLVSYSANHKTADCSYSIPDGIDVIRDISCAVNFNSETISTKEQFDKALSHSAGASFHRFGFHFSANGDYKSVSSQVTTGNHVFVLSQAKCQQFFAQINEFQPPPFHPTFIGWIKKLNNTGRMRDYLEFISYYGTHFITEAAFGARYVNLISMTTETYNSMKNKNINVNVHASYHGWFSIGAGAHYKFSESEKTSMSNFYNSVSTKVITIGTPPSDMNATKWANQVFKTPVPISYKLQPIDQLFTDKFMGNDVGNIDYDTIRKNLLHVMNIQYPKEIFDRSTNIKCRVVNVPFKLPSDICFQQDLMHASSMLSGTDCQSDCLQSPDCLGANFGSQCHVLYRLSYSQEKGMEASQNQQNVQCQNYVFPYRLSSNYGRSDHPEWLWLMGVTAANPQAGWTKATPGECEENCVKNLKCVAVSIKETNQCGLFTDQQIQVAKLAKDILSKVGFVKVC